MGLDNMSMLFIIYGFLIVSCQSQNEQAYCSFFDNRAPQPQNNLSNCTWYSQESCCRETELQITFAKMKPLPGASKDCVRFLNYLMCYICSPKQYLFYTAETLRVCENFCNEIFEVCRYATLKGSLLHEIYVNGSDFCKSRSFKVIKPSEDPHGRSCFHMTGYHGMYSKNKATMTMLSGSINFFIILIMFFLLQ